MKFPGSKGPTRFRSTGIDLKLRILVGLGFLVGTGLILFSQTAARIDAAREDRRETSVQIVATLASLSSGVIEKENSSAIYSYMEILTTNPRAAGIAIVKGNKTIQSQQSVDYLDLAIEDLSKQALSASASGQLKIEDSGDYQFVSAPIRDAASRVVGGLGVAWNTKGLLAAVWRDALVTAFILALIAGLILYAMSLFVRRLITKPLANIASEMDRLSAPENPASQSPVSIDYSFRKDEIGSLAHALDQLREHSSEARRLNVHLDACLTNMAQGLCMFDKDWRLVISNDRYCAMYNIPPEHLRPGMTLNELAETNIAGGLFPDKSADGHLKRVKWEAPDWPDTKIEQLENSHTISISRRAVAGGGWVITHTDITKIRRIEDRITYMAHHDSLTDLPNRLYLRERLMESLATLRRGESCAVLCLDLDRFKTANDVYGHPVGDKLLRAVSERLRDCLGDGDVVGRLGGDEFAILQKSECQPEDAANLARKVCEMLSAPFDLGGHEIMIGASVGIAIAPADGNNPDTLFKNADLALYRAKHDGRGKFRFFEAEMDEIAQERRKLELELRKAFELGQFELQYQPLLNLQTGEISGFEALLRWSHPQRGMVPPIEFIPIAEETGMIIPLGDWVIRTACEQAANWPRNVHLAVNLSPLQFQNDNLVQTVFQAIANSGLEPNRLELEITESILLQDDQSTLRKLHSLRQLGVRIAMDDFGTGYSSLSYLRSFPFDKVKVDRSFVRDLTEAQGDSAIVNAVASMCHSLGIATTAEGVETEEQLRLVRAAGYDEIQGYLISKPRSAADLPELFAARNALPRHSANVA